MLELRETYSNQLELLLPRLYLDGKKIKLIELFGGIGSQAKALEVLSTHYPQVVFESHKLIEFDRYCVDSYNAVHNTNYVPKDITKISYKDLEIKSDENIYLLTYSFPCQDLSIIGKKQGMKKGSGTQSSLLWEVERLLQEGKEKQLPHILLMENVPLIEGAKNIYNFNLWKRILNELGYTNFVKQLRSKDYGIPQNRNRCFMISILKDKNYYYFPEKIERRIKLNNILETTKNIKKKYFIIDGTLKFLLQENVKGFDRKSRFLTDLNKDRECAFTLTTSHGNSAIDNFILEDETIKNAKLLVEKSSDELEHILKGKVRKLTEKECWRLMGFEDKDFYKAQKVVSSSQLYKQAGNSIVVTVLIAIFSGLYKNIDYEYIINSYIQKGIVEAKDDKEK